MCKQDLAKYFQKLTSFILRFEPIILLNMPSLIKLFVEIIRIFNGTASSQFIGIHVFNRIQLYNNFVTFNFLHS